MEQEAIAAGKNCISCHAEIYADSRFCNHCGNLQTEADPVDLQDKWLSLQQTALFYAIQLSLCLLFTFVNDLKTFGWSIICDACLAGTAILFFAYNWADNKYLLKWPDFSAQKLALYCAVAFAGALAISYIVTLINHTLYDKEIDYYQFFLENGHGKLWMICTIAVAPALFEELAYRGFVLQNFIKIVDARQAAFITSFLFAAIHLRFISLFWLIPFALLLSHVRLREKTIWYGVFMHFCFNLTACLLAIL